MSEARLRRKRSVTTEWRYLSENQGTEISPDKLPVSLSFQKFDSAMPNSLRSSERLNSKTSLNTVNEASNSAVSSTPAFHFELGSKSKELAIFPRAAWIILLKMVDIKDSVTKMTAVNRATRQLVFSLNSVLLENFLLTYSLSKKLAQTETASKLNFVEFVRTTEAAQAKAHAKMLQVFDNINSFRNWKQTFIAARKSKSKGAKKDWTGS